MEGHESTRACLLLCQIENLCFGTSVGALKESVITLNSIGLDTLFIDADIRPQETRVKLIA